MCRGFAFLASLVFAWLASSSSQAQGIVAETFMVPAADPGIQLYVGNKHLEGQVNFSGERVVLFVHGATYPSETVFDLDGICGDEEQNCDRERATFALTAKSSRD